MKEVALGQGVGLGIVPSLMFKRDVSSIIAKRHQLPPSPSTATPARDVYHALTEVNVQEEARHVARDFLNAQLANADSLKGGLPEDMTDLLGWLEQRCTQVQRDYRDYLTARHQGKPRRYFTCKSHALHFLQAMAPSRLAEGAWLYGFLQHWRDERFVPLCRIYLKNLGNGEACCNQVHLYQKLLEQNDCADGLCMRDQYYLQGAIRLALGYHVDQYLPEIIGFNLGYKQTSLQMLIAAYELSELEIQPQYFTLHATEDDACIASAIRWLPELLANADNEQEREVLLQRINCGYKLHQLGMDIPSLVKSFDLQQEFLAVMLPCAAYLERSYRIDGMERGVRGRWSDSLPFMVLMRHLWDEGWMQLDEAGKCRLWHTLERGNALPQGYQQQVMKDWLENQAELGKQLHHVHFAGVLNPPLPLVNNTCSEQSMMDNIGESSTTAEIMDCMIRLMSPLLHHTQEGLKAARVYKSILEKGSELYSQHYAFFLLRDQS